MFLPISAKCMKVHFFITLNQLVGGSIPPRLIIWFFLRRTLKTPMVRKTLQSSKLKVARLVHVTHRDQVERALTDWLKEAFDTSELLSEKREGKPLKAN